MRSRQPIPFLRPRLDKVDEIRDVLPSHTSVLLEILEVGLDTVIGGDVLLEREGDVATQGGVEGLKLFGGGESHSKLDSFYMASEISLIQLGWDYSPGLTENVPLLLLGEVVELRCKQGSQSALAVERPRSKSGQNSDLLRTTHNLLPVEQVPLERREHLILAGLPGRL